MNRLKCGGRVPPVPLPPAPPDYGEGGTGPEPPDIGAAVNSSSSSWWWQRLEGLSAHADNLLLTSEFDTSAAQVKRISSQSKLILAANPLT